MTLIQTGRLQLIPLTLEQLQNYITNPTKLEQKLGFAVSREIVTDRLRRAIAMKVGKMERVPPLEHEWYTYWLIVLKDQPFGAGLAGFKGLPDAQGQAEIGYGIDPICQNKGYMTEAVKALIEWAFQDARCRAVIAPDTKKWNTASNHVLKKAGMQVYGETKDALDWRMDEEEQAKFSTNAENNIRAEGAMKTKILITGGCGEIGSYFAKFAADRYQVRIVDRVAWDPQDQGSPPGESLVADLQDPAACRKACEDMDLVVHLAADPDPEADFYGSLLSNNIQGTYNMFRAAKDAGCKRFIFASSAHVVSAYPAGIQIDQERTLKPGNLYGATKCFGEALAAYFAYREQLSSIVLRIGAYTFPKDYENFSLEELDAFLDPDDFNQLLIRCLETPEIQFAIAHAISNNRYKRLDLSETREIFGYRPKADAFEIFRVLPGGEGVA
jgi:nucleoside-diphosphate-sugar epimerase